MPGDLAVAAVFAVVTLVIVLVPATSSTPLAVLLALPFSLFLPGYVLIAALFPERRRSAGTDERASRAGPDGPGLSGIARVTLSVALSAVVVPLVGMALILAGVGLRLVPVAVAVAAVVVGGAGVAVLRRAALAPERRFHASLASLPVVAHDDGEPSGAADVALTVVLVLSVLLAAGSGAYALTSGDGGESYTEFYLLAENETGDAVAGSYPTSFTRGESRPVTVAIANHESEPVNYTVVTLLQRAEVRSDSVAVSEGTRLDAFGVTVGADQRRTIRRQVTPTMEGDGLRLLFLLYRGDSPRDPGVDDAYRTTRLWINVTAA